MNLKKLAKYRDIRILKRIIRYMKPWQRREWFCKIKMAERGVNFPEMADKIKTPAWYLNAMVCGGYYLHGRWVNSNLNPKAINIIQNFLSVDLEPFLNPVEIERYNAAFTDKGEL